ncbi:MAG: hypothetical protein WCV84_05725 [Patescibacteria group bacterium]
MDSLNQALAILRSIRGLPSQADAILLYIQVWGFVGIVLLFAIFLLMLGCLYQTAGTRKEERRMIKDIHRKLFPEQYEGKKRP